jgi:hypothetical protein
MKSLGFVLGFLASLVFLLFAAAVIFAYPIMFCWNYGVVAAVDGANKIDFWQALTLFLVFRLLVGNSSRLETDSKKK